MGGEFLIATVVIPVTRIALALLLASLGAAAAQPVDKAPGRSARPDAGGKPAQKASAEPAASAAGPAASSAGWKKANKEKGAVKADGPSANQR